VTASLLVVEDDPDLLALLELFLSEAGHAVRIAPDGRAALERVAERMPDLILLDMRLPVMNGWEFARAFAQRHGRAAPIIVLTAAENAQLRAAEIGADGWLAKPFDLDAVLSLVDRILAGRRHSAAGPATTG
jgi:DNA-binding response OmpR family regulator